MIATVTLNPAVDKTLNTSRVVLGAVNRSDSVDNIAGGKGINVAKVLRQYGEEVKTLGFLGGYTGKIIKDTVENLGAVPCFTNVLGETRTSINVISEDGYITEFLEPGPKISENELNRFYRNYRKQIKDCELVVISGSAPQGVDASFYAKLIKAAKKMGKNVLLDTSGNNLKKGVEALPYMIKPNLKELESLMGRRVQGMPEVTLAALSLVEKGIPNVLVSMGSKGIVYAFDENGEKKALYIHAPQIKVVNTVGSGDSAVAAFALACSMGLNKEDTLKKCVAISVSNAMSMENGVIDIDIADNIEKSLRLNDIIQ